jgi:uncharacterized membrane protein YccC
MENLLKINKIRCWVSLLIALILSLIANYYLAATEVFLIPLTAIFTMQTSIGNSFYQGMQKLLIVLAMVAIASLALHSFSFFYNMTHDVLIGGIIGIMTNLFFLPRKPDKEFREKLIPVIKTFNDYFSKIIDQLLQQDSSKFDNAALENALLKLPDWVYERGFNNALQMGYRFFLVKVEQLSDVLLSMHHLARYQYEKELIAKIRPTLLQYVDNVNQFFTSVMTVLELKTLSEEPSDLEAELTELQKQFFTIVPSSLELLDMRRDYVYLAAFIYNLRDLRKLLLKMGEALR